MTYNPDAVKAKLREQIIFEVERPPVQSKGGQQVGGARFPSTVTLICDELDLKITVGFHRQVTKNRELATVLFEIAMDEMLKP